MSLIRVMVGIRASVGAAAWLAPGLAGRAFGLDADANPQLPYVGRLFGVRDLALAVGLQSSRGRARRRWLQMGLLCDAADSVAGVLAGRNGELSPASAARVTAPALLGIWLGVAALRGRE